MTRPIDRITTFAAVLLLLATYLFVYRPGESAVAARFASLDDARLALAHAQEVSTSYASLAAREQSLHQWLVEIGAVGTRSAIVDRFLRVLAAIASNEHVRVTAIVTSDAPLVGATASPVDEIPLTISLQGRYGDVFRLTRALNSVQLAARVRLDSLTNARPQLQTNPDLRATLVVTLLRELPSTSPVRPGHHGTA